MKELGMGDIGSDGCPCGQVITDTYRIVAHCWKSGSCKEHEYACVHYKAKRGYAKKAREHAMRLKTYIKKAWFCHVDIGVIHDCYY